MSQDAKLSECGRYRYWLTRVWDEQKPMVCFIGLNPSTADATKDDPTIRKCIKFAKSWGYGGLLMLNLYAYRATQPSAMWKARKSQYIDIVGSPHNTFQALLDYLKQFSVGRTIAAWGKGKQSDRGREAALYVPHLDCLHKNADGSPKHPLYVRDDSRPIPWNYSELEKL